MKKVIGAFLTVILLASFVSCGEPADPTTSESAPPSSGELQATSAPPEESVNRIPASYTNLAALCDGVVTPGLYWNGEFPGLEYGREHLEVTEELQAAVCKILTENEPVLQPDMLDDDTRDRAGEAIIFELWESDDGKYPSGSQLFFTVLMPLGPNDPVAPNSTYLTTAMSEEGYVYPAEVYDELLALFQANIEETHADFEGEYTRMEPARAEQYPEWGDSLECGGVLLHSSSEYTNGQNPPMNWQIEAFDLATGESLYRLDSSSYGDRGGLVRIAALTDYSETDYVAFFENGYAYRSSKDSAVEYYYPLPAEVTPAAAYDVDDDSIAWADSDGIHLRTAKQDGVTEKLILANAELAAQFPRPDSPEGLVYISPRFLLNGQRVVTTVYSETTVDSFAVAAYNVLTGETFSPHVFFPPNSAKYPITDRYAVIGNFAPETLFDAETGEVSDLPPGRMYFSYDYKTVVLMDYTSLDANNAPSYVCDITNIADRSKPLLIPGQPEARVYLADVTENYAVFNVRDFDGDWIATARYRDGNAASGSATPSLPELLEDSEPELSRAS